MHFCETIRGRLRRNAVVTFRTFLRGKIPVAVLIALAGPCSAQVSATGSTGPLQCTTAAVPRTLRSGGSTELIGDIVLTCTGGARMVPGSPIPVANITVSLGTTVSNRIVGSDRLVDSLLLIDEPGSGLPAVVPGFGPDAPQIPCIAGDGETFGAAAGGCTEFAGAGPIPTAVFAPGSLRAGANLFIGTASENQVTFHGIPILPPIGTTRVFRITNIRANVSGLPGSGPRPLLASIAISANAALPLSNPVLPAGIVNAALSTSIRNADNTDVLSAAVSFGQCSSVTIAPVAVLQFTELFGSSFKTRVAPTAITNGQASVQQNLPGRMYNSESGFATFAFGNPVGLADSGTRLKAVFDSVPAGVRLFVSVTNLAAGANSATVLQPSQTSATSFARLIGGEALPDANGTVPAVIPTMSLNGSPGITDVAEIAVRNGSATAVWEVINTNPADLETFRFGFWIAYSADAAPTGPAAGTATITLGFAPTPGPLTFSVAGAGLASATLPLPRFVDTPQSGAGLFAISACQTVLLFPYVTNQAGWDTGMVIANTSQDPFSERASSGACVLNWYDGRSHLPANTGNIAAGTVYTDLASSLLPDGFTGYVIARCGFPLAHGFAAVGEFGLRNLAVGYLALVLGTGSRTRNLNGSSETLLQ
jgi:hypothetical protein